jgi:hypothetical protein
MWHWIIEVRLVDDDFWEVAAVAGDRGMALALAAELEHDGNAARLRERADLLPHEAEALHRRVENRTAEQLARWEPYYDRASVRLHATKTPSRAARGPRRPVARRPRT